MGRGISEGHIPEVKEGLSAIAAGRLLWRDEELRRLPQEGEFECHGCGDFLAPILPNLIAPLSESGQVQEIPQVDYVPDVGGYLEELLDLVRALSWSIMTDGLFTPRPGWSNHFMVLW